MDGAPNRTLDLRGRAITRGDLPQLQEVWPADVQVLNLESNALDYFNALRLPSGLRVLKLARNHIARLGSCKLPPYLEILDLSFNRISSVGVSSLDLPILIELNVECNRIKALNAIDVIVQCAAYCTSLQSLLIGGNDFREPELSRLLSDSGVPISETKSKGRGILSFMCYSRNDAESSSDTLRRDLGRKSLDVIRMIADSSAEKDRLLRSNRLLHNGDYRWFLFPERIDFHIRHLMHLQMSVESNRSTETGLTAFKLADLTKLDLSGGNISASSFDSLAVVLQRVPSLIELNLSLNWFPGDSILVVLKEVHSSLKVLNLRNIGMTANFMAAKSTASFKFRSLDHLILSDNSDLEVSGFVFLLSSLPVNNLIYLEASNCSLNLSDSHSTDVQNHHHALISVFQHMTILQSLDLSNNELGTSAIEGLLRALSPDPEGFGCNFSSAYIQNDTTLFNARPSCRWISPLKHLNLAYTGCKLLGSSTSRYFDNWFNSIVPQMTNLSYLFLCGNECILNINPDVSCLKHLQLLNLENCKNLLTIPDELILGSHSRPFELILNGCDSLEYPPTKIVAKGLDCIRRFVDVEDSEKIALTNVKVILLGSRGSGRRKFLNALANVQNSENKSFDEMNRLINMQYRSKKRWWQKSSDHSPNLSFWNIGGILEYSSHLNFYMPSRQCVFVIIFSVLDTHEMLVQQISYWISIIFHHVKHHSFQIFLIGSNVDEVHSSFTDHHKDGIRELINKILRIMGIHALVDKKIFLDRWFSANTQYSGYSRNVEQITNEIFDSSASLLSGCDVLRFPKSLSRIFKEVKKLSDICLATKTLPLIKLSDLTVKDGYEALANSHSNRRKFDAISVLREAGTLICYTDVHDELWICVDLNFCVDIVSLFTENILNLKQDSGFRGAPIMTKSSLYRIVQGVFESAVTGVSWYSSSLGTNYPESLFGFFLAQELLLRVPASHFMEYCETSDEHLFFIPLLLNGKPDSWRAVFGDLLHDTSVRRWDFGKPLRIKGMRFSSASIEFFIPATIFFKIMLKKCRDPGLMWCAAFAYHVEGSTIFVRLADDRHGIDVVIIGNDAPIHECIIYEIESIVKDAGLIGNPMLLCPLCCTSDNYVKFGTARIFFEQQINHYREYGLSAVCLHNHVLEVSQVEEGEIFNMPAAPDAEGPFFPDVCRANEYVRKTILWLDDEPQSNESIRRGIPGYMGISELMNGNLSLQFDYRNVEPANQMDVYCFKTVESIKKFMMQPENRRFANFPSSMFRIVSIRHLFVTGGGLCEFLDDPATPWAFSYPSTMIFCRGAINGPDFFNKRPNIVESALERDCIAFISFGFTLPSFNSPIARTDLNWLLAAATSSASSGKSLTNSSK